MKFFKNNKTTVVVTFLVLLSMSFIKCANESKRLGVLPGAELDQESPLDSTAAPQITTLTDIINNSGPTQSYIAKEIFIKQTLDRVVEEGLKMLNLPIDELPWEKVHKLFTEMGANPHDAFSVGQRVHVHSTEAVNGLRYLNAGFNVMANELDKAEIEEKFLAFEVEKFDDNFNVTIDFLRESFLGEDAEPCSDTLLDQVFFKKDEWLVEVFKETEDSIDLNSVYPPRTLDDVGVVRVSISSGGHYHSLEGSCFPEHHHQHKHEEEQATPEVTEGEVPK